MMILNHPTTDEAQRAAPEFQRPSVHWQQLRNTYICRAQVTPTEHGYCAKALRVNNLTAEGTSEADAIEKLRHAYSELLGGKGQVLGLRLAGLTEFFGQHQKQLLVTVNGPSVQDINGFYDDNELTDSEVSDLDSLCKTKAARPTIPLVRAEER